MTLKRILGRDDFTTGPDDRERDPAPAFPADLKRPVNSASKILTLLIS